MKKIHQKRLAKLALALLENRDTVPIDMNSYICESVGASVWFPSPKELPKTPACGTTCCFLGYAPTVFPQARKAFHWEEVYRFICGEYASSCFYFEKLYRNLFSCNWPNDACRLGAISARAFRLTN